MQINDTRRKPHIAALTHAPAGRLALAIIGTLFLGGALSRSAFAQVASMHAAVKRSVPEVQTALERAVSTQTSDINSAQGPGGGAIGPGPGCNLFPAPASIGASVPLSYFGQPPSDTNRSLVGPVQLLNTGQVDTTNGTITVPLCTWAI